ncbi:hypothetical protein [Granulosicoccus antarcticus]|nr:hypothetical protein [Granulosicoccus antarcticus]
MTSSLHAQERTPFAEALTETTKEFLSDRGRTGSLIGSIIAGAAVANPLAPLLGSVAGFMIGKSSAFSDKDNNASRRQAYNNRSLIPDGGGVQVTGLTGLTGNQSQASEQSILMAVPVDTGMEDPSEQPVVLGAANEAVFGNQPEQIEQTTLLDSTGQSRMGSQSGSRQIEQTVALGFPGETGAQNQFEDEVEEPIDQTVAMGLPENIQARINLQKQLAYACSNVEVSQPLSSNCYYYSQ